MVSENVVSRKINSNFYCSNIVKSKIYIKQKFSNKNMQEE